MGALGLRAEREDEIVTELAGHLQQLYEEFRLQGLPSEEARARALGAASDWAALQREISRAENEEDAMNHRSKSIWLPGWITLTLSMSLLALLDAVGLHPRIVWINNPPLIVSLPWLVVLPAVGALGAYLSRRARGRVWQRLIAGVFPAVAMGSFFLAVLPLSLTVDSHVPTRLVLSGLASGLLGWVAIPAAALLVGTLPFLGSPHPEIASSAT